MNKTKLGHPVPQLPVKDVEETQVYYRDVLGFEISWIYPDKSIGAVARDHLAIFFSQTNELIAPNFHWIYADDVDATYAEFKDSGAEVFEDIEDKAWNMRQFAIRDLNGHVFYVHHEI